ncbi:DUF4184 family protein [Actinacidiphila epipremni]|uniref:DUF4184 family protein n=1 Tax=Actinacidiphila epipremni TaxID=2053013 RepID=A0ABX0ZYI5_9ACTN|nr:DUF4184 family protein [Actinacidiphila epipremni]NJP47349.1 DUF4184 family protein [Actinacidiphila epipremni]
MPFTLSHPAAVLPLLPAGRARGPLVASALVAGSLAPDVPFFTESLAHGTFGFGEFTHSPLGVPTADVAIAAVLVAGWHWLLREPLVALLPVRWAGAAEALTAPAGRGRGPADAAWFAVSAAAGAATHVVWDAFTHGGRWGVRLLPVLDRTVLGRPLFYDLQFGTSVLGLGAITWYAAGVLRRAAPPDAAPAPVRSRLRLAPRTKAAATVMVGAATAAGVVARLARWGPGPLRDATVLDLIPAVAFGGGAGAAVGLAGYAALARAAVARRGRAV